MFEIWTGERGDPDRKHYAIYADGRVEGFGEKPMVLNRLHRFTDRAIAEINKASGAIVEHVRRELGL